MSSVTPIGLAASLRRLHAENAHLQQEARDARADGYLEGLGEGLAAGVRIAMDSLHSRHNVRPTVRSVR